MRYIREGVQDLCFSNNKMAFVSGPRQVGKTFFAKDILSGRLGKYYNYDERSTKTQWVKDPNSFIETGLRTKPLYIFDEFHKAKKWKSDLKGIYDTLPEPVDILVTGSSKLNVYKKGGDSLLGRYFPFRLHPFTVAEVENKNFSPINFIDEIFSSENNQAKSLQATFQDLLEFGCFPEPFLKQQQRFSNAWSKTRLDLLIRQDLLDLSKVYDLDRIEVLCSLLAERVTSIVNIQNLRTLLEVDYSSVKRWLSLLEQLYYSYQIGTYKTFVSRGIKKQKKIYLWNHLELSTPGMRYENFVANSLLKLCHYLTDYGYGNYELSFLKDKSGLEIDFLILKDKKPFLPVEVKSGSAAPSKAWRRFMPQIECNRGIQLIKEPGCWQKYEEGGKTVLLISAAEFLSHLC